MSEQSRLKDSPPARCHGCVSRERPALEFDNEEKGLFHSLVGTCSAESRTTMPNPRKLASVLADTGMSELFFSSYVCYYLFIFFWSARFSLPRVLLVDTALPSEIS